MRPGRPPFAALALAALCILLPAAGSCAENGAATQSVPLFGGMWRPASRTFEAPPGGGPGPVMNFKDVPRWRGDYNNPILKPSAAEAVKKEGDLEAAGASALTGQNTCKPSGVPDIYTVPDVVQIVQTPTDIAFLYARDHMVRIVHMNAKHPDKPKPSWWGDSVGHYEGDTLVVDTTGFNDKTWTDRFATPHTEALHVVERYRVTDGGKMLEVNFTVEDPNTFTTPWSGLFRYGRAQGLIAEEVCSENNRDLASSSGEMPIPKATYTPPF